jgi:hypothetical protein
MIKKSYVRVVRNAQGFKELAAIRLIKMCDFIVCFSNIHLFSVEIQTCVKDQQFFSPQTQAFKRKF